MNCFASLLVDNVVKVGGLMVPVLDGLAGAHLLTIHLQLQGVPAEQCVETPEDYL